MTDFLAFPPAAEVRGRVRVPPSKSATNRALVAAALGDAVVEIRNPLESDDTEALVDCLGAMGARIRRIPRGLAVSGPPLGDPAREIVLDCRDSGTAARFLIAVAATTPGRFRVTGSERLRQRPMAELVEALSALGARIVSEGEGGGLPLRVDGARLRSSSVSVDSSRSSQFLSALLLAGLSVDGGLRVRAAGSVVSAPYVRMTVETLRELGHRIEDDDGGGFHVTRGERVATRYEVPGDYSSAIPLLAAAGAAGGRVSLTGLRWPSGDADAGALPLLQELGLRLETTGEEVAASGDRGSLRPIRAHAADFPDAVPALAALAALAPGESRFTGIAHLRVKESDRIAALASLLSAAGARAEASSETLTVVGPATPVATPTRLPTAGDHRMAMAAGLLSLRLPNLLIQDPACVRKSYPGYFRDLASLVVR